MATTADLSQVLADITSFIQTDILNEMGDDGGEELTVDTPLLEWGILDSITMVKLVDHLNQRYDIRIREEDVIPANFLHISAIGNLVMAAIERSKASSALGDDVFAHYRHEMDGYELQVKEFRIGANTVSAILIHGTEVEWVLLAPLGFPAGCLRGVIWGLESYHPGYALDLPGFGLAPNPPDLLSSGALVDLVADYLGTLEDRKVVLMGHGLSAVVASAVAKKRPQQIQTLLVTGLGKIADGADYMAAHRAHLAAASEWLDKGHFYATKLDNHLVQLLEKVLHSEAYAKICDGLTGDLANWHEGLQVPTLFIHGENDPFTTAESVQAAAAAIPGSVVKTLARCGHFPAFECPDEMIQMVRSFLRTLH